MDLLDRLLQHDACTTARLLAHAATVSDEEWTRSLPIGPGSLAATFDHVISAMDRWAQRLADRTPIDAPADHDRRAMPARLDRASEALAIAARRLHDEGRLDEMMSGTFGGTSYSFTRGTAIAHVVTHGMHHRAQIFNMLRQLDRPAPIDGDVIEWELAGR